MVHYSLLLTETVQRRVKQKNVKMTFKAGSVKSFKNTWDISKVNYGTDCCWQ